MWNIDHDIKEIDKYFDAGHLEAKSESRPGDQVLFLVGSQRTRPLAQHKFLYLARGVPGQLIHEHHLLGHHEARNLATAEGTETQTHLGAFPSLVQTGA
jgi:hypothetical protein